MKRSILAALLILLLPMPILVSIPLSGFAQQENADIQEGSAGGQTDVPAVNDPAISRGLDQRRGLTQAVPSAPPEAPPREFTKEGLVAKERAEQDEVELTTKVIVTADSRGAELTPPGAAAPLPSAPILGVSFPGVTDTGSFPPDPTIAAGPFNVVVAANGAVNTFDKAGTLLSSQSLAAFFAPLGQAATDGPFDPWLIFDPYIDRFWLIAVSRNAANQRSRLLIALSNSSNVTAAGSWAFFSMDARLNGNKNSGFWCDYPKIGIDAQAVIFTCNMFTFAKKPSFEYAKMRIMTKDQFINNTCCLWWDRWDLKGDPFTVQPALMHGAVVADGMYLINAAGRGASGNELIVWHVRNAQNCCIPGAQSSPDLERKSHKVGSYSTPRNATQLGTKTRIDTGDTRLLFAFWQGGFLSTGQNLACGSLACIGFTELDVSEYPTIRVVNDFAHSVAPLHLYYPHVAVNSQDDKTMVFSASDNKQFVDVRYIGIPASSKCRNCTDGPHTVIAPGQNMYVRLDKNKKNRWGDYSGSAVDPDGIGIWVHGEFAAAAANTWGTQVALTRESVPIIAVDLVPFTSRPGDFCNLLPRSLSLILTVNNRGSVGAPSTITQVDFRDGTSFTLPTPPIASSSSIDLPPLNIPSGCFMPDCSFRITVDATGLVNELDESNNSVLGECAG